VWLAADTGVTIDGSGNVSNWDNQGTGADVTQANAAARPFLIASDANLNNKPSVSFDGINDILHVNDTSIAAAAPGLTVYVVAQHRSTSAAKQLIGASNGDYGGASQWMVLETGASSYSYRLHRDSITDASGTNGSLDTNGHIFSVIYDGAAQTLTQRIDNNAPASVSALFSNTSLSVLDIGAQIHFGTGFDFGDYDIAEILVYDVALSAGDRTTVANYLNDKYFVVPEPASLSLIALSSLLMSRRRNRALA